MSSFQPNEPYIAIIIDANSHVFHETYLLDGYDGGREVASVFQKQLYERYPDHPLIHVTILVNAYRLSRKLYQYFLEVSMEQIYQFMSGKKG